MKPELKTVYNIVKKSHNEAYPILKQLEGGLQSENKLTELVDIAYAMRECEKLLEDFRKTCKRIQEISGQIACVLAVKEQRVENVKTEYATGTPEVKFAAQLPSKSKNPEQYAKLMTGLGVPNNLWKGDNDVVRPHWPGFRDYLSVLCTLGEPLPDGIDLDKTYPNYQLRLRSRKSINE